MITWEDSRQSMCCDVIVPPVAATTPSAENLHHCLYHHPAVAPLIGKVSEIASFAEFKKPAAVMSRMNFNYIVFQG